MQKFSIQSKDIVSNVPDAFEKLRRERREQPSSERILSWVRDVSPTRRSTRSRRPLGEIPNHNPSNSGTSRLVRDNFLKKEASSVVPHGRTAEDSTKPSPARPPPKMDIFEDAVASSAAPRPSSPRKRGRPKKGVAVEEQNPAIAKGQEIMSPTGLSGLSIEDPFVLSPRSQEPDINLSPPNSPSRTCSNTTTTVSTVLEREDLRYLTPPIKFMSIRQVKGVGGLPEMTSQLWLKHVHPAISESRVIPAYLEDQLMTECNTPMKSKPMIATDSFGSVAHYNPLDHNLVWLTVSDVVYMTEQYLHRETGSHWTSVVVNPLLHLVRRLTKFQGEFGKPMLEILDITTVKICPRSLCPFAEEPALFKELNKRIDCAVGLRLSYAEKYTLGRGHFQAFSKPSINQTSTFVNLTPMFINIAVKRSDSNQDPLIQLAAWVAAEFEKRKIEGYSLDMLVLAIEVVEQNWGLYMVYANVKDGGRYSCNFVGPFHMGSTASVEGAFRILGILCSLASWGLADYRAWFEREILAKYKK